MSDRPTKLQRWLDVIAYLAGRRLPVSTEQLWAAVPAYATGLDGTDKEKQTVRRMFERDKDELRRLGIPVETVSYSINFGLEQAAGYRLATKDFHMPYLRLVAAAKPGRVRVSRADGFERPTRLTPEEALCLALALRGSAAAARMQAPVARDRLLDRAERYLAHRSWEGEDAPVVEAPDRAPDPEGIREVLLAGARDRRPCAIAYVKPGADDAKLRVVHPYAIAHGEGAWYAVAHCTVEDGVRVFRVDRIVAADIAEGRFEVPPEFEPDAYVDGGRIFHAEREREVRVRYSPRIARWIRERAFWTEDAVEDGEDGSVVVRHRVADPRWAVSHALQYGADAEILEPEDVRALALEVARGLLSHP